eukprot:TRINITY_DN4554_c0_g1_i5.p1 TRINITY_DN4554_c0_g1~~TRINITY_DN4554_c0_g1_i5.p1  ORF type:complete len:218 (+),score=22.73 TRINITY_DN4554_c0_g1_i5:50-655(+)
MLKGNRGHHSLRGGGTHGLSILALCVAGLLLLTLFWQVQNSKKTQLEIKQKYEAEISNYQETKDKLLWQLTEKQDESQRCTELMKSKTQEMNELETKLRKQEQDKSDAESEHSKLMESIQTYQTTIQSNEEKIQGMEAALKQETINKNIVKSQGRKIRTWNCVHSWIEICERGLGGVNGRGFESSSKIFTAIYLKIGRHSM